jgi:hypothetical protein
LARPPGSSWSLINVGWMGWDDPNYSAASLFLEM